MSAKTSYVHLHTGVRIPLLGGDEVTALYPHEGVEFTPEGVFLPEFVGGFEFRIIPREWGTIVSVGEGTGLTLWFKRDHAEAARIAAFLLRAGGRHKPR